jgi:hypothetical protein
MPFNFFFVRSCAVFAALFILNSAFAQLFSNVSQSAQLNFYSSSLANYSGVSAVDFNQDGYDDLTFSMNDSVAFMQNNGDGTFSQVKLMALSSPYFSALQWMDYDNDGDYDFWCTQQYGSWQLMRNDGTDGFVNVVAEAGLTLDAYGIQYGSTWGDYDRDGDLDLYICMYMEEEWEGYDEQLFENKLYQNQGNGTFLEVGNSTSTDDGLKLSLQATFFDFNRDLWPDIYVANDKSGANSLYKNNGNGTFSNVATSTNTSIAPIEAMSTTLDDINNDGFEDIFVSGTNAQVNQLLRNNQGNTYQNITMSCGMPVMIQSWHGSFEDFNNDGLRDLMMCQSIYPSNKSATMYLQNNGNSTFSFNVNSSGLSQPGQTNMSGVPIDFNNDGALDFFVPNTYPVTYSMWQNNMPQNNWVKVQLKGVLSNRDGIGSWVDVWTNGIKRSFFTHCGEGFLSQSSFTEHLGLGASASIDSLLVSWPSGWVDKYFNLDANQKYVFHEGETFEVALNHNLLYQCSDSIFEVSTLQNFPYEYLWSNGDTSAAVSITEPGTYFVRVTHPLGFHATSDTLVIVDQRNSGISFIVTAPLCAGESTASIQAVNSTNALLSWGEANSPTNFEGLASGYYPFSIAYGTTCVKDTIIFIPEPQPYLPTVSSFNSTCYGYADGSIQIEFEAYQTSSMWVNGLEIGTDSLSVLAGTYQVQLVSELGCSYDTIVAISEPSPLQLTIENIELSCFGESTFPATPQITGGTGSYTHYWTDVSGENPFSDQDLLHAGQYMVRVSDANGCWTAQNFEVTQPELLAVETDFYYTPNSVVHNVSSITGGTAPFNVAWVFEGQQMEGMSIEVPSCGNLTWLVTDAHGCTAEGAMNCTSVMEKTLELDIYPNPTNEFVSVKYPGGENAEVRIFDIAGKLMIQRRIGHGIGQIDLGTLSSGMYKINVTDGNWAYTSTVVKL